MSDAVTVRHVGVVVSDLDKALHIYRTYLKCDLVTEYPHLQGEYLSNLVGFENVRLRIAILRTENDNRIELLQYLSHVPRRPDSVLANTIGVSHFALEVKNLEGLYQQRGAYDVAFVSPPQRNPEGTALVAYVVVMHEHLIELVQLLN